MKDAGGIADELKLLISPYWNVNKVTSQFFDNKVTLLISPYWNVNKDIITSQELI